MGAGGKLGQKMDEEKERGKLATPGGGRRCWYRVNLGFDFFFFKNKQVFHLVLSTSTRSIISIQFYFFFDKINSVF